MVLRSATAPSLLTFLLLLVGVSACRQGESFTAVAYNDRIVAELDRASRRIAVYYTGPEYDLAQLEALQNYLLAARDRIAAMPPYDGDSSLRDEALNVMNFYVRLCREQSRSLISLTGDEYYTIQDSLLVRRIVASILVEENRYNAKLKEKQEAFARKYGLLLVQNNY